MKCPHCLVEYHSDPEIVNIKGDIDGLWNLQYEKCPSCGKNIVSLLNGIVDGKGWQIRRENFIKGFLVYPKSASRVKCPPEVPEPFAEDYNEASLILTDSPKASAALSRRCLQILLREKAKVKPQDLSKEIDEILARTELPSHLSESIDAIRSIGNFAAHPIKSKSSGEIVPVEKGEAEWLLDVLEGLFDFYFVQPAITARKKAEWTKKLQDAGKPPLK